MFRRAVCSDPIDVFSCAAAYKTGERQAHGHTAARRHSLYSYYKPKQTANVFFSLTFNEEIASHPSVPHIIDK